MITCRNGPYPDNILQIPEMQIELRKIADTPRFCQFLCRVQGRQVVWKVLMGALGLVAGLVALLMGMGGAGGGHGWVGAFWFSVPLLILYPLVFIRAVSSSTESPDKDILILLVGGVLDLLLAANMMAEQEYVLKLWTFDPSGMIAWLALWAGWQVLGLVTVIRKWFGRMSSKTAPS